MLRFLHFLFLSIFLELLVEGKNGKPRGKGAGHFLNGVEYPPNWVDNEWGSTTHNPKPKLKWPLDEPFCRFFLEGFEPSTNIFEQRYRVANDVEGTEDLVQLAQNRWLVVLHQFLLDALQGVDAVDQVDAL